MGQNWEIVNLDRKERYHNATYKMGEWFFQDQHDELIDLLRAKSPMSMPDNIRKRLRDGKRAIQSSKLLRLPNELIDMIFEELYGEYDNTLLHFAITCKAILGISERHIVKFYQELYYSWQNCRLICVGDDVDHDDVLPAGVLTDTELKWIESERESLGSCHSIFVETFKQEPRERQRWFKPLACWEDLYESWRRNGYTSLKGAFEVDVEMMRDFCNFKRVSMTSRADLEVLCNITKREYVRDPVVADREIPQCVTLAHALITLICWSPSANYALSYNLEAVKKMKRGRWAGDRFRIVTEVALAEMEEEGWTDVTEDATVILRHLAEENRGDWAWCRKLLQDSKSGK